MSWPSLQVGAAAWRAAQAAGWLSALLRDAPGDDVLDGLRATGEPPGGWWEVMAALRAEPHSVLLALPRPGDPRRVPMPDLHAEGAVGCMAAASGRWLLALPDGSWARLVHEGLPPLPATPADADRDLRGALVASAHALDDAGANPFGAGLPSGIDRTVDAWLASSVPVDPAARGIAARGLRLLLAATTGLSRLDITDTTTAADGRRRGALLAIEPAARAAVEAAYSSVADAG